MYNFKTKLKNSKFTKVTLGVVLSAVMTTSVFAATGVFNSTEVTQEELNSHIQETVNKQLQDKIAALSQSQKDELSKTVAEKINTEEVLAKLREQVEAKLKESTKDLKINQAELDKLISDTIDSVLNSIIDETISTSIDSALANIDLSNISLDDALRTEVSSTVESQIRKIIYDNIEQITSDSLDKIITDKKAEKSEDKPSEEPINGLKISDISSSCEAIESDSSIRLCTHNSIKYLVMDPKSDYTGRSVQDFLSDNKSLLDIQYTESDYGWYITNIKSILPDTNHVMLKKNDSVYRGMNYISFYVDPENDGIAEYSQYGAGDTSITENGVYIYTVDSYSSFEDSDKIATITSYEPGNLPYSVNMWGSSQSNFHHSWVLEISNLFDDELKVEDVVNVLGFEVEVSGTGYVAFKYNGNRISQSAVVSGRRAFVPTFYSLTITDGTPKLGYAKGINPAKSSVEKIASGVTQKYYAANEWDGKTQPEDVVFE